MKRLVTRLAVLALVIFFTLTSLAFATTYDFSGAFAVSPLITLLFPGQPSDFSGSVTYDDGRGVMDVHYSLVGQNYYDWVGPVTVSQSQDTTIFYGDAYGPGPYGPMELILVNAIGGLNPADVLNTQWPNGTGIGGSLTSLESSNVPLPPSLVLLFSGLLAMIVFRRPKYNFGLIRIK